MDIEKTKRYSLMELTLLAVLMMGLAAAWIIVKQRDHVPLSEPIVLDGAGLSVRVPVGTGWEHTPAWVHESDNSMALLAQRRMMKQTEVELRWRYIFCARQRSLPEVLSERLTKTDNVIEPLEMPKGSPMEAARVITPRQQYQQTQYFAIANLGHGRVVELQVTPGPNFDLLYAEALLRDTAMAMVYQTTEEIVAGETLLERFFSTLKAEPAKEEAFLVSDVHGRTTGFYYTQYQSAQDSASLQLDSRHYDAQSFMMESVLQIGPKQQPLQWDTRVTMAMAAGLRRYDIQLNEDGSLTVASNFEKEKTLYPDPYILPELMLVDFVRLYMGSKEESVVAPLLSGLGLVVPIRIQTIPLEEASAKTEHAARAVRVEYLHAVSFFDELYFNDKNEMIGRFERQPRREDRLWDKTTTQELLKVFGDKLNLVQRDRTGGVRI